MEQNQYLKGIVNQSKLGQRLDKVLAELFPNYSRTIIKSCIHDGMVKVNGQVTILPKTKMIGGELVEIKIVIKKKPSKETKIIMLNIVYEDEYIIVINKPRNIVMHPGPGNVDGTILNALIQHFPPIVDVPRAGIVHRLDKDTTGLVVVAKTVPAQISLMNSIRARKITREYEAVAIGNMISGGIIKQPITRHPIKRTCMAVHPNGKPSVTKYFILESFRAHTHLRLRLETGRTHQIRVHMAHINHPLVGDQLYGGYRKTTKIVFDTLKDILRSFNRQALHSTLLRLYHPIASIEMEWHAPLPQDMFTLIEALKVDAKMLKSSID